MNPLSFLFDECVNHDIIDCLRGFDSAIDVLAVGEPGAPLKGTLDSDLLVAAESLGRVLISGDRSSMIRHLNDHFRAGRHTHGVILLRSGFAIAHYATDLHLIWFATGRDEWLDRTDFIPY